MKFFILALLFGLNGFAANNIGAANAANQINALNLLRSLDDRLAGPLTIKPLSASSDSTTAIITSSVLPDGASTSAAQATSNGYLLSLDNKTPSLGQASAANSTPVVLTAAQLSTLTPLTSVTANIGSTNGLALDSTVAKDSSLTTLNSSVNSLLKPSSTLTAVTTVGSVTSITNPVAVTGTFYQATQPVNGTVTANLGTLNGAATAANQSTSNGYLLSIDGKTPALGQALAAGSVPVVLTAAQLSTLTPLTSVTANIGTTNGLALDSTVAKDSSLTTLNAKDFATQTTLAQIKAKTDNIDVLLSTRTKPADTQIISGTVTANLGTLNGAATAANQATMQATMTSIDGKLTSPIAVTSTPAGAGTKTPGFLVTSSSSSVSSGATSVSFYNSGSADGSVLGSTLAAGETVRFSAPAGSTLSSIAYVATGTTFKIAEVR